MNFTSNKLSVEENVLFQKHYRESNKNVDIMFVWLFIFEWVLAITISLLLSPSSWVGLTSSIHPHVHMSIFLGGTLTLFPVYFILKHREDELNKYIVCFSQITYASLLIHITGGRIETHFHLFGSLAFLAFYRNPKVILMATFLTTVDHFGRGVFMPESIYGVSSASFWRASEHAAWVIFEDIFLFIAIKQSLQSLEEMAVRENMLANSLQNIEEIVEDRSAQLLKSQRLVLDQQESMANSARLSSLGEMAAGIAHEINNPLAIISSTSKFLKKQMAKGTLIPDTINECLQDIDVTVERVSKIITGLRNLSRDSEDESFSDIYINEIITDVLAVCSERFKNHSVDLQIDETSYRVNTSVHCKRVQISQVLLNLVSNSFDAIQESTPPKWIRISIENAANDATLIKISDSGPGIPEAVKLKMFQPFFTTKDIGKGTGLGLSLSKTIMEKHGGSLVFDENIAHTQFSILILGRKKES